MQSPNTQTVHEVLSLDLCEEPYHPELEAKVMMEEPCHPDDVAPEGLGADEIDWDSHDYE